MGETKLAACAYVTATAVVAAASAQLPPLHSLENARLTFCPYSSCTQADSWQQQQQQLPPGLGAGLGGFGQVRCSAQDVLALLLWPVAASQLPCETAPSLTQHYSELFSQADVGGGMEEEDASSRASSPAKSPLLGAQQGQQGSPFLDQDDRPLAQQPPGSRAAARLSQQGISGGGKPPQLHVAFDGSGGAAAAAAAAAGLDLQQTLRRPASPLGRRPGLPNWQADEAAPVALHSGGLCGRSTPPARLFSGGGGGLGGGGGGLFGGGAAPSDPVTYQMQAQLDGDGVPNMGEVQEDGGLSGAPGLPRSQSAAAAAAQHAAAAQQPWHIPAVHNGGTPGSASRRRVSGAGEVSAGGTKRGMPDKKPGAAFKLGKRSAYLKYLAYEVCEEHAGPRTLGVEHEAKIINCGVHVLYYVGKCALTFALLPMMVCLLVKSLLCLQGCWQLCLEELLSGSDATATTFLANGCRSLKKALNVEQLFLTPFSVDPSLYTQDGMQCIW